MVRNFTSSEAPALATDALLPEEDRPPRVELDRQRDHGEQGRRDQQQRRRPREIHRALQEAGRTRQHRRVDSQAR